MNHRARKYGAPSLQSRRDNVLPPNPQLRPYPRYPQNGALYRMSNSSHTANSSYPSGQWHSGWNFVNRIRSYLNWILKIGHFIQSRIREKAGANGCSTGCVGVGAAITVTCAVVSTTLSIGLSVGIKSDYEPSSFNFTASQTGLFNDPTTWIGRIVPYGNATVIIPSGITVTIAGSSLDVLVLTFDIYGTLAVGQGASNFKFSYPTAVIIRSGGTLKDLTTSKSVTFTSDTLITALDGSINFGNDTSVVIGSSSGKRAIGDVLRFSSAPFTCGIINSGGLTFPRINPICRRNGSILSAYTYLGGFAPTASVCGISGCGIYIPTGISISTSEVSGILSIRISYLDVAAGANLSIGSSGVWGFKFSYAIQIEVYGVLSFVGSGGSLQIPVGSAFNIYSGASFIPTTAASVSIVSIDTPDNSPGVEVTLVGGTSGPFYMDILSSGAIGINHETPAGNILTS